VVMVVAPVFGLSSLRGAKATKQSILPVCGAMDCFAVLAMTAWRS
jgi:hypothetical protein